MTPEQSQALDIARALAAAGIPIFMAWPDPAPSEGTTGYLLPNRWQQTEPDPGVVDHWRPGMALCAVMGRGLDLIDVDAYKGASADDLAAELATRLPVSYGAALTPSGGVHSFVRSMGVRSRNGVVPGIDVKAGLPDGKGRGFAFIAPTVRVSKSTGQPAAYRWVVPPDLAALTAALQHSTGPDADLSGAGLAALVEHKAGSGTGDAGGDPESFMQSGPWANVETTLAAGRNNGVARLAAALRGRGGWKLDDALEYMRTTVWPVIDQNQGGHPFGLDEFESTIAAAWRQYDDGAEQRAAAAAIPPLPPVPVSPDGPGVYGEQHLLENPARYFDKTVGFLAKTLAFDAMLLPLRQGADNILWSYDAGVWHADRNVVRRRSALVMGERYRPTHGRNAEEIVGSHLQRDNRTISCDPIPELVNFRNGLLRWEANNGRGELLPHTPDVPSTVQLAVDYDPDADCPAFEKFLYEVLPADMVDAVWELIGYLIYSGNPLHKAVMLTGTGRNGKGTFLRVMLALLGRRNVTSVSLHDLVNTRFTTASLFGKLANIAGDIDAGYLENTATFKAITGGDTISAEHKGRDRFDFTPWAVPVFSANRIPASADTTIGYLSRWLVVPFPHDFSGREDRRLDLKLHLPEELRGIAARGIAALPRLLERGDFELTESALAALDEFVRRVDQVRTWIADCADISTAEPHHPWVNRTELYEAYKRWAARDGHKPLRASEFYDRLEAAGAEPAKVMGARGFKRIRIIDNGWIVITGPGASGGPPQGAQDAVGAAGAATPDPAQGDAQQGQDLGAATGPTAAHGQPELPLNPEIGPVPAPNPKLGLTSANADVTHGLGALGADRPQPPSCARTQVGGYAPAAPTAPKASEGPKSAPKPGTKAAAKLEAQRAAFEAAAGPRTDLPALATRDGQVLSIGADDARALLGTITGAGATGAGALTVDVEHTGYPVGHADYRLKTVQLGNAAFTVVLDPGAPDQAAVVRDQLAAAPKLHAHSAAADLVPLGYDGLLVGRDGAPGADGIESAWDRMYDTVIPAKLADPASTAGAEDGLKDLAAGVLGLGPGGAVSPSAEAARIELFKAGRWLTKLKPTTPVERSGWAQVDPGCRTMAWYAAGDVLDDAALAERLPWPEPAVLERERLAQRMTARVSHHGLRIDGDHVRAMLAEHEPARERYAEQIRTLSGGRIDNPGSDRQIATCLTDLGIRLPRTKPSAKFPDGQASVAEGVLDPLRDTEGQAGDLIRAVLDFRHHDTAIGTFLEPYASLVDHGDGRARPVVYTMEAKTGRMSCRRPNLQQVPREGGFRACITADPGQLLVSADFSGVELRVAAALSQDRALAQMLANGIDLHWEAARQVFGPNATKSDRYKVKRGVFGWLYGGGIQAMANGMGGVPHEVAGHLRDTLSAMVPGVVEWTRQTSDGVKAGRSQFQTHSGRIIHMPIRTPHAAPNYCIQGTARELLIDALVRWRDTRWGANVLLPVHDELVVLVPEQDAEEATRTLVECMQTDLFGIPIIAEPSAPSFAWSDAA